MIAKKRVYIYEIFVILISFVLLINGLNSVYAAKADKKASLPGPIEAYLQFQAKQANLTGIEIDEARTLWLQKLALRQEFIDQSNCAITNEGLVKREPINMGISHGSTNRLTNAEYYSYIKDSIRTEPLGNPRNGTIEEPRSLMNPYPDGYLTRFYTPALDDFSDSSQFCFASDVCEMNNYDQEAQFFIYAKLGPIQPQLPGNYIVIEQADIVNDTWQGWVDGFVGYAQITTPNSEDAELYYVGYTDCQLQYVTVAADVFSDPNESDQFNDVMVDCVFAKWGDPPEISPVPPEIEIRVGNNGEGGTTDPEQHINLIYHPETATIWAIPYAGYEFDHWVKDSDEENPITENPLIIGAPHPCIVEAYFMVAERTLTVSYTQGGYTTPSAGNYVYAKDDTATVTALSYSGYVFDHWLIEGVPDGCDLTKQVVMDQDYSLQAVFRQATNYYGLTVGYGEGGTTDPSGTYSLLEGTTVHIAASPESGYRFSYWVVDESSYRFDSEFDLYVTGTHSFAAVFEPDNCLLTVRAVDYAFSQDMSADVYIGSGLDYLGTTEFSTSLPVGTYLFTFQNIAWSEYGGWVSTYYGELDSQYLGNGYEYQVTLTEPAQTLTVYYISGK